MAITRREFVRGGVSNLFGAGSVAGLINYISKTGSDTPEATVQLEFADENRARGDFAMSGPLGQDSSLYYALSGFYRYDEGPIDTGNDTAICHLQSWWLMPLTESMLRQDEWVKEQEQWSRDFSKVMENFVGPPAPTARRRRRR